MRILVTGSAGFIGSWIADDLAIKGHEVMGLDDLSGGFKANVDFQRQRFERINLANQEGRRLVEHIAPEVVFHLAANAREGASQFDPANVCRRNLMAFANTIEGAIAGGKLKKCVLFSSMARYGTGMPDGPPFPETNEPCPVDVYGANKVCMERCLEALAEVHGFEYTILAPHNVAGPRQCLRDPARNVLAIWMNSIMRGEPVIIFGDGKQKRAFSYIRDSLPCYIEALTAGAGQVINIGGLSPVTILEAAEMVRGAMKPQYQPTNIIHVEDRPREVKDAWCTVAKSEKLLGFVEKTPMREWIDEMARWAKKMGPQRWVEVKLPLMNALVPRPWDPKDALFRGGMPQRHKA